MKTLYLDCGMGAAGDMLTAALLELFSDQEAVVRELNSLQIPGIQYIAETSVKCGITGTHMTVKVNGEEEDEHMHEHHHHEHEHEHELEHHHDHEHEHLHHEHDHDHHHDHDHDHEHHHDHDHEHHHDHDHEHHHDHDHEHDHHHDHGHAHSHSHSGMADIAHIVSHLPLSEKVRTDVLAVYDLIAQAESKAHGKPVDQIHFHEVGTMDAVADVTAVCYLMEKLQVGKVIASPIHVGSGHVHCAHGILPVPAPATAHILQNVPIYGGAVRGELCTPTGAALLKHFVTEFGQMPVMTTSAIGYGMGKKDFEQANCVRALLGETADTHNTAVELVCNLDDMTGEAIGFAMERLLEGGALDVFTTPIGMKKNRPAVMLTVLCNESSKENLVRMIFQHTTTIGIRESLCHRYVLDRSIETVETPCGTVRRKVVSGYGTARAKAEFEDLAKIALERNISLKEAEALLK